MSLLQKAQGLSGILAKKKASRKLCALFVVVADIQKDVQSFTWKGGVSGIFSIIVAALGKDRTIWRVGKG